ncbi:MAG: hypothetical protein GY851_03360 [bacterium]|nr:hypothetical protein [bacterium]
MAATPNSIITPQSITTIVGQIATGDQTTAATAGSATTNGRLIYKVLVYPAASNREVTLYDFDGTSARAICLVDITADAAADIVPVDLLSNVPCPIDACGNKFYLMQAGHSVYLSAENVAVTNDYSIVCEDL